jgi:hypothetical protein
MNIIHKLYGHVNNHLDSINTSKIFAGIMMICLNIGSKFITVKLSKSQEDYIRNYVAREVLIFAACWMGTRDIILSIVLTTCFFILSEHLFNENSSYCVIKHKFKELQSVIDVNNDNEVSPAEIADAVKLLTRAKEHKQNKQKENVYRYFMTNKY